jgi:methoxymalonate biosynthesis acyl carrier protein
MTSQTTDTAAVEAELLEFLRGRFGPDVAADQDLFASGLIASLFALQLVVHLESSYGVTVGGEDLAIANFRSARDMAALVARLRGAPA